MKSKQQSERDVRYAHGGSTRMLGKGDRTTTASTDAANPQAAGGTAHKTLGKNQKQVAGGPRTSRGASLAMPAAAGKTAPPKKGR